MLIGLGKSVKKVVPQGPFTVSFTVYDPNMPATMSGDTPTISDKMAGETFTLPTQGNLVRTETSLYWNGSSMQTVYHNISLIGWTDGNGLYAPGSTYTMSTANVTFKAIWNTIYGPDIQNVTPTTVSVGDTVTITGINLGSTEYVEFDNGVLADVIHIISDDEIRVVVPPTAQSGSIVVQNYSGSIDFEFDVITII